MQARIDELERALDDLYLVSVTPMDKRRYASLEEKRADARAALNKSPRT